MIFNQIRSDDIVVKISGYAQFEMLYHLCNNFGLQTKYRNTKWYIMAFNIVPRMRHMFNATISEDFQKELLEIVKLKLKENLL